MTDTPDWADEAIHPDFRQAYRLGRIAGLREAAEIAENVGHKKRHKHPPRQREANAAEAISSSIRAAADKLEGQANAQKPA